MPGRNPYPGANAPRFLTHFGKIPQTLYASTWTEHFKALFCPLHTLRHHPSCIAPQAKQPSEERKERRKRLTSTRLNDKAICMKLLQAQGLALALCLCNCAPQQATQTCPKAPTPKGEIIAQVGNVQIGSYRIQTRLDRQQAMPDGDPKNLAQTIIDDEVRFELLAAAACERGLHRDPDMIHAMRKAMVHRLLGSDFNAPSHQAVSDERVTRYYRAHQNTYSQAEKRKLLWWTIPGQNAAERSLAEVKAATLLAQSQESDLSLWDTKAAYVWLGQHFQARAEEITTLPFVSQSEAQAHLGDAGAAAVFAPSKTGWLKKLISTDKGIVVALVLAIRPKLLRPQSEVADEIRTRLSRDARKESFERYLDQLQKRFPVRIYDDAWKKVSQP